MPTQTYHIGRDGTIYPPLHSNWSHLRYGTADPDSPNFNALAAWHVDLEKGMIEVRIPWICLFVIDPPNRAIMADLLPGGRSLGTVTAQTPGIGIIAFTYDPKQPQKAPQSLPEAHHDVILRSNTSTLSVKRPSSSSL